MRGGGESKARFGGRRGCLIQGEVLGLREVEDFPEGAVLVLALQKKVNNDGEVGEDI